MKIYLSSKGIRPDIDNSGIINRALESAKDGSTIVWKDGLFPVSSTIVQRKTLHWEGAEETTLVAMRPLTFAQFAGGYKSVISRVNFKGSYSIYDKAGPTFDGVAVNSLVRIIDCTVRNVWGNGITVSADLSTGKGNASKSKFENLDIIECRGHGMYFQGGDANQCSSYDIDIRDCNGIGICDDSFLGNQFFNCMTHNNKGGSYRAGDVNNFTGFYGCYAEGGQIPVYLEGHACWFGGLPYDGVNVVNKNVRIYSFTDIQISY